jgi:hypothetical protein
MNNGNQPENVTNYFNKKPKLKKRIKIISPQKFWSKKRLNSAPIKQKPYNLLRHQSAILSEPACSAETFFPFFWHHGTISTCGIVRKSSLA